MLPSRANPGLQYHSTLQPCLDPPVGIAGQDFFAAATPETGLPTRTTGSRAARRDGVTRPATLRRVAFCTGPFRLSGMLTLPGLGPGWIASSFKMNRFWSLRRGGGWGRLKRVSHGSDSNTRDRVARSLELRTLVSAT